MEGRSGTAHRQIQPADTGKPHLSRLGVSRFDLVGLCTTGRRITNRVARGPNGRLFPDFNASPSTVRGPFSELARLVADSKRGQIAVNRASVGATRERDGWPTSASPRTERGPFFTDQSSRLVRELRLIVVNRPP